LASSLYSCRMATWGARPALVYLSCTAALLLEGVNSWQAACVLASSCTSGGSSTPWGLGPSGSNACTLALRPSSRVARVAMREFTSLHSIPMPAMMSVAWRPRSATWSITFASTLSSRSA